MQPHSILCFETSEQFERKKPAYPLFFPRPISGTGLAFDDYSRSQIFQLRIEPKLLNLRIVVEVVVRVVCCKRNFFFSFFKRELALVIVVILL